MTAAQVEIKSADPRSPGIRALIAELDELMGKLYPAESNYLMNLDALCAPEVAFFGAYVGGTAVGCGAVKRFADYVEVKRIFVAPRTRGLGVARKIMKTLEEATRAAGVAIMRLETGIYQPEALALFESFGFKRREGFGDYPQDDPNSVFMERTLT
jgi:putative acetyltransferase